MLEQWTIPYPASTGEEDRKVYVWLPRVRNAGERFPVLYMFDGHNLFDDREATYGKSWGLKKYLSRHRVPLIVVGVECNHSPDHGRLREYAPFSFSARGIGQIEAEGEATMEWFVNVLKPLIDERYPTLSARQHTFIGGSSMGGLMSLYAISRYNHIFSRAAALSPSIWVAPKDVENMIRQSHYASGTVVYMDYGQKEMANHKETIRAFSQAAALLTKSKVLVTSRIVPGGTHCEASWEKQIPFFLPTLLYQQS